MSTPTNELKYFEKLNISSLNIETIKKIIKKNIKYTLMAWDNKKNVDRQCFHIIGPAGVGKTDIMKQISEEITKETGKNFDTIIIKAPVLFKDDMIVPFPVSDSKFKMLYSDFVPNENQEYGIFVIDEFARGDHALQQLMWQVQNEYAIHTFKFPKGWFVVSLDNPDDREYSMNTFEDAAGLRRQLHFFVQLSVVDFLNHARKKEFHDYVIQFIETYPEYLYDFDSQRKGAVYANPASWEKVSDHLIKYDQEKDGIRNNTDEIEIVISGLLNINMANIFISFVKDKDSHITPSDIFNSYKKVEKKIKGYVKEGDNAKLSELVNSLCIFLSSNMPKYDDKNIDNVATFLSTIPLDTSVIFATHIDTLDKKGESIRYFLMLNNKLVEKSDRYKEVFFERLASM